MYYSKYTTDCVSVRNSKHSFYEPAIAQLFMTTPRKSSKKLQKTVQNVKNMKQPYTPMNFCWKITFKWQKVERKGHFRNPYVILIDYKFTIDFEKLSLILRKFILRGNN